MNRWGDPLTPLYMRVSHTAVRGSVGLPDSNSRAWIDHNYIKGGDSTFKPTLFSANSVEVKYSHNPWEEGSLYNIFYLVRGDVYYQKYYPHILRSQLYMVKFLKERGYINKNEAVELKSSLKRLFEAKRKDMEARIQEDVAKRKAREGER